MATVHNTIPETLSKVFTHLIRFQIHPTPWKTVKRILIPKPGKKETDDANRYGPTALLTCLGKALEKVLARRIALSATRIGAIAQTRIGFQANRSIQDAVLTLLTTTQNWLVDGKTRYRK